MSKHLSLLLVLLAATSLLALACQAPAPTAPAEPAAAVTTAPPEPAAAESTTSPSEVAASTEPSEPAVATQASSPVSETQAVEAPDPIAADPNRPGLTMDGSPSLGDPNAAVVIVDFSDFQ